MLYRRSLRPCRYPRFRELPVVPGSLRPKVGAAALRGGFVGYPAGTGGNIAAGVAGGGLASVLSGYE